MFNGLSIILVLFSCFMSLLKIIDVIQDVESPTVYDSGVADAPALMRPDITTHYRT